MEANVPRIEEGYRDYRRRLLATLGRMAHGGYAVPPSDGLGIVHDFFVEAWPGLQNRYDPSKGPVSGYIVGAFVRFARPRIVRQARWRQELLPPEELAMAFDRVSTAETPDSSLDTDVVRRALHTLSPALRWVLEARLAAGHSERDVAQRFELSRYRLRETCAEALGRLAVAIDEPGVIATNEWPVARALWGDESTLPEVAERLGLTQEQAKRARQRALERLAAAVQSASGESADDRRNVMTGLCSLWKQLLADPRNSEVGQRARTHADELLDHIDECMDCLGAAEGAQNLTEVYELIAPEDGLSVEDAATLQNLVRARQDDDAAVSRAVEDALLPSLGGDLANLAAIDAELTPLRLFLAVDAVSMLVHRLGRTAPGSDAPLFMTSSGAITDGTRAIVAADVVIEEISQVASVSLATAHKLAREWIPRSARRQPLLFLGLVSEPSGRGDVRLRLSRRDPNEDLLERWRPARMRELVR